MLLGFILQETNFQNYLASVVKYLSTSLVGPWRRRSFGIISLLLGYYLGSNLTVYFLQEIGQRPFVVFVMVLLVELLIRLRNRVNNNPWPLYWLAIDNIRIGAVYSVVLEAFKLGS